MKKILFSLMAILTITTMSATTIWTESVNRNVGNLNVGDVNNIGTNQTDWWFTTGTTSYIQVKDTALAYPNYCSNPIGKAINFVGNTNKDVRAFNGIKSGKVYYGMLLNVQALKNSTTKDYMIALLEDGNTVAKYNYARLNIVNDFSKSQFKIGISKAGDFYRWSQPLEPQTTYLIVVGYEFKDGANNDVASLWINPTKLDENNPALVCVQDTANGAGDPKGASSIADATNLTHMYLKPGTGTPSNILVDEIKLVTAWNDLFEGAAGDDPAISVPEKVTFDYVFSTETYSQKVSILGENLTEGVTLTHTNTEVTLSATSFTKAAVEAGAELTLTLAPATAGEGKDTVVITSGTLTKKIALSWASTAVKTCADIATLKAEAAKEEAWSMYLKYTGEAIVTRDTVISELQEFYLQDATGAVKLTDDLQLMAVDLKAGDKVKNMIVLNGDLSFGVQPMIASAVGPTVVSSGNAVTPQIVTLAQLQTNPLDYLLELVTVEKVTLDNTAGTFSAGNFKMTQGEKTANLKVEMSTGITGNPIPALATVTGFSFNTSGSVIMPRSMKDIQDVSPKPLIANGGFEKYTTKSQGMFGTVTTYEDWTIGTIAGITTEATDVKEGKNALRTTSDLSRTTSFYQSVDMSSFAVGETFQFTLWYKVLNSKGTNDLTLASCWSQYSGITSPDEGLDQDKEKLQLVLPSSGEWTKYSIQTTKPEKGNYFELNLKVLQKAEVLLDSFCLEKVEMTEPWFAVVPEKDYYDVSADINTEKTVATLTIKQGNLTQPVKLELSGTGKDQFAIDKTQVTAAEEKVVVTYKPTKAGKCSAVLNITDDECTATTLQNTTISLLGNCTDPSKPVKLTLTEPQKKAFSCKVGESDSTKFTVSSENATDWVHAVIEVTQQVQAGSSFMLSDSYLTKNEEHTIKLTFTPQFEGDYAATVKVYTEGFADTLRFYVTGHADKGETPQPVIDYDTTFVWNTNNPYTYLNENFASCLPAQRNKTLSVTDWQNVVLKGNRAWWGFNNDSTTQAKATGYMFGYTEVTDAEMWLVTPALKYAVANQVFAFKVMSDMLFEGQNHKLEVYFIDPSNPDDIYFQHIEDVDSLIPYADDEQENIWYPIEINLTGQEFIPDVFFMAFKYTDKACNNGGEYFITDVKWGVDVPSAMPTMKAAPRARKYIQAGHMVIEFGGYRYNIFGAKQ